MTDLSLSHDGSILSVYLAIKFRKRGGRKLIIGPTGTSAGAPETAWTPTPARTDATLIKALARAHRWKKLLDTKQYATIKEIAENEKVAARYIGQLLQFTLLAPDIIELILDGRLPRGVGLNQFMEPWPGEWGEQRRMTSACCVSLTV
ncbi:Bacteriophage-related protein [uncultured Gammaproteobacteria bacterium]